MMLLIFCFIVLTLIALGAIIYPLWHSAKTKMDPQHEANKAWYLERLADLSDAHANKELTDQQFDAEKNQLQKDFLIGYTETQPTRAFPHRVLAIICALLLMLFGYCAYHHLGAYEALAKFFSAQKDSAQMDAQVQAMGGEEAVFEKLKARLKAHPEEAQGWYLLGRIDMSKDKVHDAFDAFKKASALEPQQIDFAVALAESAYLSPNVEDKNFANAYLQKALALDPNNIAARNLSALMHYRRKEFNEAIAIWKDLLTQVPPESETAKALHAAIDNAQEALAKFSKPSPRSTHIAITVGLAPQMAHCLTPGVSLLVYAKEVDGSPMPVAITKLTTPHFPVQISLDDSMSMVPDHNLDSVSQVVVTARLSQTGQAMPQSGDCEGSSAAINTAASAHTIINIDNRD